MHYKKILNQMLNIDKHYIKKFRLIELYISRNLDISNFLSNEYKPLNNPNLS